MKISDRVILPLVGSAFQSGKAAEAIEKIEDKELAQIAQGEYYFFSAQAEKCVETVKDYLDHDDVMLRLSADMLYTFANLTLGDPQAAQAYKGRCTSVFDPGNAGGCTCECKGGLSVRILCNQHIPSYIAGGRNTAASVVHSVSANRTAVICGEPSGA